VNDTGIAMFHQVNEGSGEGGNVLVSPAALNFALATACAGAEGVTRDELREVLRHRLLGSDHNDRKLHELYRPFSTTLRDVDSKAGLHLASACWFDRDALRSAGDNLDAFGRQMAAVFGTELRDRTGTTAINNWASQSTEHLISRITSEDEEINVAPLLLTAVTAFKASWAVPFDPFHTWPSEFTNDSGEGIVCQMMHQKGKFECAYLQDMRAVCLPCGVNGETAVTFIVPNFGTIDDFVKDFTPERWQAICKSLIHEDLRLFLPQFKVESSNCALKGDLQEAGIQGIFSDANADLSRLGESGIFWLEDVLCKSLFVADESGANPVQPVEDGKFKFTCVGPDVEFRVDRPFLLVCHCGDAIVQIGKVVAPLPVTQIGR
jgi:serpin B